MGSGGLAVEACTASFLFVGEFVIHLFKNIPQAIEVFERNGEMLDIISGEFSQNGAGVSYSQSGLQISYGLDRVWRSVDYSDWHT